MVVVLTTKDKRLNRFCRVAHIHHPHSPSRDGVDIDCLHLLSLNRGDDRPRMLRSSELAVPNSLPRACCQPSISDRHCHTRPHKSRLDMRLNQSVAIILSILPERASTHRHIIRSLTTMPIQIPLPVLRRYSIKRIRHISPHILVPVLIQRQTARRMLDKKMQNADFVVL
jgi:hypothetical protein